MWNVTIHNPESEWSDWSASHKVLWVPNKVYFTLNPNRPQSNKIQQGEVKKMR